MMNATGNDEVEEETGTIDDQGGYNEDGQGNHEETTTTEEEGQDAHDDNLPMPREWIVRGGRIMNDEEYNLFVQRTTLHLLTYRNDPIVEEEEEVEDLTLYPFIAATVADDLTTVKTLLEQGIIDDNKTADLGRTAMWYAAFQGHVEILQLLIEYGSDMEMADLYGRSPLFMASIKGHIDIVRHLLEQGANRDTTCNIGWTPLHNAAEHNHLETAMLLMVYGANLNLKTTHGNNLPIDYAHTTEMIEAIRDEPRRRMDHGYKRATEQEHLNSAQEGNVIEEDVAEEPSNKLPDGEEEEEVVADEDQESEPSDSEDGTTI